MLLERGNGGAEDRHGGRLEPDGPAIFVQLTGQGRLRLAFPGGPTAVLISSLEGSLSQLRLGTGHIPVKIRDPSAVGIGAKKRVSDLPAALNAVPDGLGHEKSPRKSHFRAFTDSLLGSLVTLSSEWSSGWSSGWCP